MGVGVSSSGTDVSKIVTDTLTPLHSSPSLLDSTNDKVRISVPSICKSSIGVILIETLPLSFTIKMLSIGVKLSKSCG